MAGVEWSDEMTTGMDEIDRQHHLILDLFSRIVQALWDKQSPHQLAGIMQSSLLVLKRHLDFEEQYMRGTGWPENEGHRADHTKLLMQVAEIEESLYTTGAGWHLNMEAMNGLKEWLGAHIAEFDKPLAFHILDRERDAA